MAKLRLLFEKEVRKIGDNIELTNVKLCINENEELKEIGTLVSAELQTNDEQEYKNIETKTEAEFTVDIKNTKASKEFFREMKKLAKKDKDKKQERIHNQKNFREFIKQKMKK